VKAVMNFKRNRPEKAVVSKGETTREFLLSRLGRYRNTGSGEQTSRQPADIDVYDDRGFMGKMNALTAEAVVFGFLVVKADPSPLDDDPEDPQSRARPSDDIARVVGEVCSREDGAWGQLENGMFGCFIPGFDAEACLAVSEKIKQKIKRLKNGSVSIGAAMYPMLDYEQGQIMENARKALDHAAFFGPDSVVAFDAVSLNISGDALYQAGNIIGAVDEFERGIKIDPRDENLYNSLGVCYGVQGNLEKALEAFESAVRIDPDNVLALHNAGYSKSMLDDTEGALRYLMKADKLDGNFFEIAFHTGKLLVETGCPERGKPFLERAAQLNPDSGTVHFFIGECFREMGQKNKAITSYKLAVRRNPNDAGALSTLGLLYDEKGENPEIPLIFCEKSVELAPENGLYTYRLGCILENHGERQKALDTFERALDLGYDAEERIAKIKAALADDDSESLLSR